MSEPTPALSDASRAFVETWGEMGPTWGISRTMAQVHALLIATPGALSTDEIMAHLRISRGNANTNLRELVSWGLVRKVVRLGERKEFFEGEKRTWTIFCNIARERKRRELEPLEAALASIRARAEAGGERPEFVRQIEELQGVVHQASRALDRLGRLQDSAVLPALLQAVERFVR